ncbi:MAG TPA: nucleotidyltransferase domain-containing protein [Myxococcales bacterium]|jgi:predicted nucleotidyltransferase
MTTAIDLSTTLLPPTVQREVASFCAAVEEKLGAGLVSISLYGSGARGDFRPNKSDVNLLVVPTALGKADLEALLEPVAKARRAGIAPSFLVLGELKASTDIFPVKFLSMKESHRVLVGKDVLGSLAIGREHVRLRCEQELMQLVLELREGYLEAEGRGLEKRIAKTVGGFLDVLRIALTLTGEGLVTRREIPEAAGRRIGIDPMVLKQALELRDRDGELPAEECQALFDAYLTAAAKAARFVDSLEEKKS